MSGDWWISTIHLQQLEWELLLQDPPEFSFLGPQHTDHGETHCELQRDLPTCRVGKGQKHT